MVERDHICVCVCTYKRPERLRSLLSRLQEQQTEDRFDYSVVIVDNDQTESARAVVETFARASSVGVSYYVEPNQNIARARNLSVAHATGTLVAFIDDDELPVTGWLLHCYCTLIHFGVDGVLGPVKPFFEGVPPAWMVKARLFERWSFPTGSVIDWRFTGMGNVLLRRAALEIPGPFQHTFGSGGEDTDFFRRSMADGRVYVWCDEAEVFEAVPPERTRTSFQIRRALLRGKVALSTPSGRPLGILKSFAACVVYTAFLPVLLIMGRHVFMTYLIKDFDHIGKLIAACGVDVVGEKYLLK